MIIIAILRISRIGNEFDQANIVWMIFWQQVEACTAVIMVSLSAFRSFFVARKSRLRDDQRRHRKWYMSKKNQMASALRRKRLRHDDSEVIFQLGVIPRATMTGMSTFIGGEKSNNNESQVSTLDVESAERIKVKQSISIDQV